MYNPNNDCNLSSTGNPQNFGQSDGAKDEPAAGQPAQHAPRSPAHEQT